MAQNLILLVTITLFVFDAKTTGNLLTCYHGGNIRDVSDKYPPLPVTKDDCKACLKASVSVEQAGRTMRGAQWTCDKDNCPKDIENDCKDMTSETSDASVEGILCCCNDQPKCNGGIGVAPMMGCLVLALGALKIHGAFL